MPSRATSRQASPFEEAFDRERDFLHEVRKMIREEVERATADAVAQMVAVATSHERLTTRVDELGKHTTALFADLNRLSSWCTARGLFESKLEQKLDRVLRDYDPDKTPPHPIEPV